jgi:hypothetical protein
MRGFIGGGKEIKENRVCHLIRLCSSSALAVNKSSIKRDPKFNHACPNHSRKKKEVLSPKILTLHRGVQMADY